MNDHLDIDLLVQRLRDAAATLDPEQPPIAPPIGDWHRQLEALRARESTTYQLLVPGYPSVAELMALHLNDEAFLECLYSYLLGREIEPEAIDHYRNDLRKMGRLYVIACVAQSEECHRYRQANAITLPPLVCRVVRLHQRVQRLNRLKDWGYRRLRQWLEWLTRHHHRRWRLDAQLSHMLIHQADWNDERRLLSEAVLEMDERQRHFGHRQDHEYARQQAIWQQFAAWRRTLASGHADAPRTIGAARSDRDITSAEPPVNVPDERDAYYLAFESAFRGPEADIAAHLDHYRDAWTRARQAGEHALDLGCCRGEWLRLLVQAGFAPRGVGLNAAMVAHCREQGFDVARQDALAALDECADGSLALISGFHIAEHLPFEALFALVSEAHRALAPGGVLILETPNPENLIVASYSFYHDVTRRNPLTPSTLQFLLQFHGFGDAAIRRFNPPPEETRVPGEGPAVERLNALLTAPMDYAVIGTKGAAASSSRGGAEGAS